MSLSPRKNRQSRPGGAYSHGRADRPARIDSGVVLRGERRVQSTPPITREDLREANRMSALEAARDLAPHPGEPASEPMANSSDRELDSLRTAMNEAIAERRYTDALSHIIGLVAVNPSDPRWPHKYGDVLRTLGRHGEAAAAFRRSAARYEASGFNVRSKAMLRLADELDGKHTADPA